MTARRALVLVLVSAAPLAAGCQGSGPPAAPVKGRLVAPGGAPFHAERPAGKPLPPGDPGVRVKFTALEGAGGPGEPRPSFLAAVDPDTGAFEVPGATGRGIPAGRYEVTVYVGAVGEDPGGATGRSSNVPPTVESAGEDDPGLDGRAVARTEVTVPPEGVADLTVEVTAKKK